MTVAQRIAIRKNIAQRAETIAAEALAEKKHQARLTRGRVFAARARAKKAG